MSGEKIPKKRNQRADLLSNVALNFFVPEEPGINWDIATALAFDSSPNLEVKDIGSKREFYQQAVSVLEPLIKEFTKMKSSGVANIVLTERHTWIVNTTESIKELFDELFTPIWHLIENPKSSRLARKGSKALVTSEIGLLLGFISQKVLGQYDIRITPNKTDDVLFIVEPNIAVKERELELEGAPLRLWILAHELTHRFQFQHYKWLREYYFDLIRDVATTLEKKLKKEKLTTLGTLSLLLDKKSRDQLAKIQALMSFVEGQADFVMQKVGAILPEYERLKDVFSRRPQENTTVMKKLLEKAIGLDMKINQYKQGFAFVKAIDETRGLSSLSEIDSPEKLPTLEEISAPQKWLKRLG
ncbi:hypothetical protein LCGC14_0879660 [marine sediment metagenome]|uniref:Coenzyme F420 biosynthesis-associated protein n=1 Tax=marine sediment metagenome TaxID=412755 RepID=A0A0F9RLT0_9ZZZZ|nr:hypothetical protein [Actinomycetota bacterium]